MIRYFVLLFILIFCLMSRLWSAQVIPQEIDITGIEVLTALILSALGTIWVIRKIIKFVNRS
jgi:hypothetical protein